MYKKNYTRIFLIVVLSLMVGNVIARPDTTREYRLKAAYLLNFARFIYWPKDAFKSAEENFAICIYGDNPFGDNLNKLSDKKIQNRNISLIYPADISALSACHILYVANSKKNRLRKIIKEVSKKTILTVSDIKGFCDKGGLIEFLRVKNKIKFEINLNASSNAGIKYRSQLLDVAEQLK